MMGCLARLSALLVNLPSTRGPCHCQGSPVTAATSPLSAPGTGSAGQGSAGHGAIGLDTATAGCSPGTVGQGFTVWTIGHTAVLAQAVSGVASAP